MKTRILIIDDDKDFINDITILLSQEYECVSASNSREGFRLFHEKSPDVILLDLMLKDETNGIEVLKKFKTEDDHTPVIMITDYSSVDTAVEAIKLGASDYISKSPNLEELKLLISRSLKERQQKYHTKTLIQQSDSKFKAIIGHCSITRKLKEQISLFAKNDNTILITGESGVGKELVARQIHKLSNRSDKPFIAINCAAIPKNLIESELFGHEKGSFTGADRRRPGKFEIAENGTVFLDEISEIDFDAQVKLLRVLQEREFERIGSTKTLKANVRIIASTNRDLKNLVDQKLFRDDLYYRLDVLPIEVPPLRERKEDIPALAEHFLKLSCEDLKLTCSGITDDAIDLLMQYNWPGNIRELQNKIIRASILANGEAITQEHINSKLLPGNYDFPIKIDEVPKNLAELTEIKKNISNEVNRVVERSFLDYLIKKYNGNITQAADAVGINRSNLHKMMKKCGFKKSNI
ncbi:MAG: sigma-54-dependent Fis family transcriptional regulator [Ignavibacteriales bacterium]|jgi:DNA-binding NtrC family response regulator|nr:MAG: sigma-54-dependent Fis family transcriptional regulator [Ignavibacteriales bacterium]